MSEVTETKIEAGQTLFGRSSSYSVLQFVGEGCFGKVAKCQNLATKETVAVKILKNDPGLIQDTEKELSILEAISVLNPDHSHVVKFLESFVDHGQTCLAFEMLDGNLYDLLEEPTGEGEKPLSLHEIRPIAAQLMVALDALKGLDILHTDIKPDNVMFVRMPDQSLRVKLIDFGLARHGSQVQIGMNMQPIGYRAPEIELGLPITAAIDVWGAGCVLACLYLADNLFPVRCRYYMMKRIVELLGQPEDRLLRTGGYIRYFFKKERAADGSRWRFMTPGEYKAFNNVKPVYDPSHYKLRSLDDLVHLDPALEPAEIQDRRAFVDLLRQMLHLDGSQRISPHEALQHPFITMSHLIPDSSAIVSCDDVHITWSSDGVKTSYGNDPDLCSSDEGVPPSSDDDDPSPWLLIEVVAPPSDVDNPDSGLSNGEVPPPSPDKDPDHCLSDGEVPPPCSGGDEPTDLSLGASASPGPNKTFLKQIRRLFRRTAALCCCWRPKMED